MELLQKGPPPFNRGKKAVLKTFRSGVAHLLVLERKSGKVGARAPLGQFPHDDSVSFCISSEIPWLKYCTHENEKQKNEKNNNNNNKNRLMVGKIDHESL